jgi:hypothetical protein
MIKEIPNEKKLIFLEEYKEGFGELARLVMDFEGMTVDSQVLFLISMEENLVNQLKVIDQKKDEVMTEVKKFLAKYNSQLKALLDTENFIRDQLEHYSSIRKVITNDNEKSTKEKEAV